MPTAALMPSAVYYPPTNKIYAFGGQDGMSGTNYAITRVYDIDSNMWSTGANMPDVRSFMASAYYPANHKIYLVAGYRTGQVASQSQVWEYDPVADTFDTSRAPIPRALGGPASAVVNGSLSVAGGRDATNHVLTDNWEYRIAQNMWLLKAPVPQATNVPAGGALMGKLYLWGGGNPFLTEPWATGATWGFAPILNPGSVFGPMNVARSFPAGTFIGGMAFAAGGLTINYETTAVTETAGEVGPPPPPPPPPPGVRCRVPHVIGLRLARARLKIRRAHCAVGRVRRVRSQQVGRVIGQRPRSGARRARGFPVDLVVGRR